MDSEYRDLERQALQGDESAMHAVWARNRRMEKGCPNCGCDVKLEELIKGVSKKVASRISNLGPTGNGGDIIISAGQGSVGQGGYTGWSPLVQDASQDQHTLMAMLSNIQKTLQSICMHCGLIYIDKKFLQTVKQQIRALSDKYKSPDNASSVDL